MVLHEDRRGNLVLSAAGTWNECKQNVQAESGTWVEKTRWSYGKDDPHIVEWF